MPSAISAAAQSAATVCLFAALCLVNHPLASATSVTLQWDSNPEPGVAYRLHYGTASRQYSFSEDVGSDPSFTLRNLSPGVRYYVAVTAVNLAGLESAYSQEVSFVAKGNSIDDDPYPFPPVPLADDDGDGQNALEEFVQGTDPDHWSSNRSASLEVVRIDGVAYIAIRYYVHIRSLRHVSVRVELSRDLASGNWEPGQTVLHYAAPSADYPLVLEYVERSKYPLTSEYRQFLRLRYRVSDEQ